MQISTISLTDAASTPVVRMFSRFKTIGDTIILHYRSAAMAYIAANRFSIGRRDGDSKNGNATKLSFRLAMPTLAETSPSTSTGVSPLPVVAYEHFATIEFVMPGAGTQQERKDLLAMLRDALNESVVTSMVHDLDLPY